MANTIDFILTNAASKLISKVLSGKTLNFTRMAVGDGFSYDTTAAKDYTALVNEVLSLDISKKETLTASSVRVTSAFKNTDAQQEFYYREVGLFAEDPDTGEEVLYAYGNRNDAAELITPTGSSVITKQLSFIISVGNSANVTFSVNADVYALQEDVTTLQTTLHELNSTKANQSDLEVERARITNLATLKEGSTTGDAELIDARTDDLGITHANAGTAFRTRIDNVSKDNKLTAEHLFLYQHLMIGGTKEINLQGLLENRSIDNVTGAVAGETSIRLCTPKKLLAIPFAKLITNIDFNAYRYQCYQYDSEGNFISALNPYDNEVVLSKNTFYFRLWLRSATDNKDINADELNKFTFQLTWDYYNLDGRRDRVILNSGKNLVDTELLTDGHLVENGDITRDLSVQANYKTTDFIKMTANEKIAITNLRKLMFYDSSYKPDKNYYIDNSKYNYVFTAPYDGYVRISFLDTYLNTIQIERGDAFTSYEPFKRLLPEDISLNKNMKTEIETLVENYECNKKEVIYGNVLYGKKYVACGDSFTQGDFNGSTSQYKFTDGLYKDCNKVYPYFIGARNNMTVINEALCGSTITNIGTRTDAFSVDRYKKIPTDADYITLKFGINDDSGHQKATLGTIDDTTNTTYYGAWNVVMEHLITNHPYAKIGIIITNGTTLDIVNATKSIAIKWGVPYLDEATDGQVPLLYRTNRNDVCSVAKNIRQQAFIVSSTNAHPNEKAHEYESTFVEDFLRRL